MSEYLVFRLYGPIVSWGEVAVGGNRHSYSYQSKSAIIGLLASALGIKREDEERHNSLNRGLNLGVKIYSSGVLLRDYHTIQTRPSKSKVILATRKEELRDKIELTTILSTRDYRMDSLYDICICKTDSVSLNLEEIKSQLEQPVFALYLGRKSCTLASPLFPKIVKGKDLFDSFQIYDKELNDIFLKANIDNFFLRSQFQSNLIEYVWEGELESEALEVRNRRDNIISRKRWQFAERKEFYKSEEKSNVSIES